MRVCGRLLVVVAAIAVGFACAPLAHAAGQLRPEDDEVLSAATPAFEVELTADDANVRIDVTTEAGAVVGSCTPAPSACSLGAPLPNGVYFWTLHFQNRFCDGYQGELCGMVDRTAGPRRFEVAVPRVEPRTIVPGRSIGAARVGMSADELHELYGEPLRVRGAVDVFQVEGGVLEATLADGRVTALSTTSAYYRTAGGIGVGARAPRGWVRIGNELVRGRTRLAVSGSRVVRVTVTLTASPAARGETARSAQRR